MKQEKNELENVSKTAIQFYEHPVAVPRVKGAVLRSWLASSPERFGPKSTANINRAIKLYERQEHEYYKNMAPKLTNRKGLSPETIDYVAQRSLEIYQANHVELSDVLAGIMPQMVESPTDVALES